MARGLPRLRILHSTDGWTPEFERHFAAFYDGILARAITDPDMRESAAAPKAALRPARLRRP